MDHDPKATFKFAPLQSEVGNELLKEHGLPRDMSTVVVIDSTGEYRIELIFPPRQPRTTHPRAPGGAWNLTEVWAQTRQAPTCGRRRR